MIVIKDPQMFCDPLNVDEKHKKTRNKKSLANIIMKTRLNNYY